MSSRPVVRTVERIVVARMSLDQREQLADSLYAIVERSLAGDYLTRAKVFESYLSEPDMVVGLLRARTGEIVGFVGARITTVEHEGRRCAVFSAGVFCDLDHRGGLAAARFGLLEALRFKLRNLGRPLAYMALLFTPAPYVLHARVMRHVYPRRGVETPAIVEAWMHAAATARGLDHVRPGIIALSVHAREPSKLARSSQLDGPDARFYVERNPNWTRGEAMLVWVPLGLANVLASLPRALA
jgi:hypothetical protein